MSNFCEACSNNVSFPQNLSKELCQCRRLRHYLYTHQFVGLKQLQEWTKESLKEKPFSTAKGKIWTLTPSSIPLHKIFMKLRWVEIDRKTHKVTYVNLPDITKLLSNPKLKGKGPVRILVTGKYIHVSLLII